MLIEPSYKGFRIEVNAVHNGHHFNAEVRVRQHAVNAKPRVEVVTCLKPTAEYAERAGEVWAKRWIDRWIGLNADT